MIWNFIQLFPLEVLQDFVSIDDIRLPLLPEIISFFRSIQKAIFRLFDWGDLLLLSIAVEINLLSAAILVWNKLFLKLLSLCFHTDDLEIKVPAFVQSLVFDVLYVIILESLLAAFVCTYRCQYSPDNPPLTPYPPHDIYSQISCSSPEYTFTFILAVFSIGFYHCRASYVILHTGEEDSGIVSAPSFRYAECILRVCLSYPLLTFCF